MAYLVVFLNKWQFLVESHPFPHRTYLTPLLSEFPLDFSNGGGAQKVE